MTRRQAEWHDQWSMFQDQELFLFQDWIYPLTLEDLRGKYVLEAGCGGGQHTAMMVPYARSIVAVDLNTADLARERNKASPNAEFVEADIASMNLVKKFDVVLSVGVIHHTDDPDAAVKNLIAHLRPGGRLVLWVYSKEGNAAARYGIEPLRKLFFRHLNKPSLLIFSKALTAMMSLPIYSLYRLPLKFLPYYEYFKNFRRLSFNRNVLNVFDKLNAPQVQFISEARAQNWISGPLFRDAHVSSYRDVSWRVSGVLR